MMISDLHLGSKHAQTDHLLRFLCRFQPERLYLVGDVVDAWKINAGWYWNQTCDEIVQRLLQLSRSGTKIFCAVGNHDSFLRSTAFTRFAHEQCVSLNMADHFVFHTLHGLRLLVTHGDLYDWMEAKWQWLSRATTGIYDTLLSLDWLQHQYTGKRSGNPYATCRALKDFGKQIIRFSRHFERKLLLAATTYACHGVVCGHIHMPRLKWVDNQLFVNTGDWIENCTGLIELADGSLHLESSFGESQCLSPESVREPERVVNRTSTHPHARVA